MERGYLSYLQLGSNSMVDNVVYRKWAMVVAFPADKTAIVDVNIDVAVVVVADVGVDNVVPARADYKLVYYIELNQFPFFQI